MFKYKPPKKKGEKGKGKKGIKKAGSGKVQVIIDGVPIKSMTRDQLEGHVVRLRSEVDLEREERNFLQCETERLQRLWEISTESLDSIRGQMRLKEAEIASKEKETHMQLRTSHRKTKTLMNEQETHIGEIQMQSQKSLLNLQVIHLEEQATLNEDKESIRTEMRKMQANYLLLIAKLKLEHSRELEHERSSFESELRSSEDKHIDRMKNLQEQLDLKRKNEIAQLREQRSSFLTKIIKNHEDELENLTENYGDMTNANLRLVAQLRTELEDQRNEGLKVAQATAKRSDEKATLRRQLHDIGKQLSDSQRTVKRTSNLSSQLNTVERKLREETKERKILLSELEGTTALYKQAKKERDELYDHFVRVVAEVHHRSNMKSTALENKLNDLSNKLEKKDAILCEVVQGANLDPTSLSTITRQLEEIIEEKNRTVHNLQKEVATMRRMYAEALSKKSVLSKS